MHETSNLLHSHLLMQLAQHVDQHVFWDTFAAVLLNIGLETIVFHAALQYVAVTGPLAKG